MNAPIFIVGANRSGTTLLRLILNAHSRIAIPEEFIYFNSKLAGISIQRWRDPQLTRSGYRDFVRGFLHGAQEAIIPLRPEQLERLIIADSAVDLRRPYQLALESWAHHFGKVRWGEKTPGNLFYADIILEMFPDSRFIYLMRDPRAGVHSMMRTHIFSDDVAINALNRRKYNEDGLLFLERHVPSDQRLLLRYEDLVSEPESSVRKICDFVGEPFEPEMLRFHETAERFMKARAAAEFNQAATNPITDRSMHAWRTQLRAREIAVVEIICRRSMRRFGYARETRFRGPRVALDMLVKTLYWRVRCWRNRQSPQFILKNAMFQRKRNRMRNMFRGVAQGYVPFHRSTQSHES